MHKKMVYHLDMYNTILYFKTYCDWNYIIQYKNVKTEI